jgi:hypothetical protein
MKNFGEKLSLAILTLIYLLCSLRYFPNQPTASLLSTATHLLTIAPFLVGAILFFNSFYQRQTGERPVAAKMVRIGLTMGIIIEFFIGLNNFWESNNVG